MRCLVFSLLIALSLPALAAEPTPKIERDVAAPQAIGALHTLRAIPEACARMQGKFTGDPAQPYAFDVVRTSANCQPRARLVDAAKVEPSTAKGWEFNDLIRVPSAECPAQMVVVRVWHRPADATPPELDAQGRARLYLDESQQGAGDKLAQLPLYAASMTLEGEACTSDP